jgi:two-component system, cell cycle response regulator DivK
MALILVVEDDETNQELVTRFLWRCGHQVLRAADGMDAVKKASERIPDLILMDLNLPGMDGWEAAGLIKSKPETGHIPIIALTANKLSGDVEKALGSGIDGYETKPVVYQRLMKKIAELC